MEIQPIENSQPSTNSFDDGVPHSDDNVVPQAADTNGGEESEHKLSAEEVKNVLGIIASTGKFWHDWDELKPMLSFQLKQVLSEYPEATKGDDQHGSLGESYPDLVKRLEEALFSFTEGPPFTLQRLCEILLNARAIYSNTSKLALALEKNLLVTSTLTRSTDLYPPSMGQAPDTREEQIQDNHTPPPPPPQCNAVENGREPLTGDRDEVMTQLDAEAGEGMAIDVETFEDMISSEANPEPANNS